MNKMKQCISEELWDKTGELLEMIPEEKWQSHLFHVVVNLLIKERENVEYLTRRLAVFEEEIIWD